MLRYFSVPKNKYFEVPHLLSLAFTGCDEDLRVPHRVVRRDITVTRRLSTTICVV